MKTKLPIEIFPIEDDGIHLKVKIIINKKEASLIVDTGASRTVFDEYRIVEFIGDNLIEDQDRLSSGIGTNTMVSKKVIIEKLQLGKIEINKYNATILDLKHVNQSYESLNIDLVDGILGGDILNDYKAVIDYSKEELLLTTP